MNKILALITLTYKESVRKRVFLIIALFTIALISSSAFFPVVASSDRVRLVEIWSLRGISIFGSFLAIFLAGISIPADLEDKRIFFVLTKPISKEVFILGKFLGFVFVMAIFVFTLGIISLVYLYTVDFVSTPGKSALTNPVEKIKATRFSFIQPNNQPASLKGTYDEKEGLSVTLEGEAGNQGRWYFTNLNQYNLSVLPEIELTARILKEKYIRMAEVMIIFENPLNQKRDIKLHQLTYQKPLRVDFDPACIDASGGLYVTVFPREENTTLTLSPESLLIITAPGNFAWNFTKNLIMIFLQMVLIVVIMIAGSTVLSAGVNVFMGLFVYLIGSGMDFCRESLQVMERAMEVIKTRQLMGQAAPPDAFPLWMMQSSKTIMDTAFKILPDLGVFDGTTLLLKNVSIDMGLLGQSLSYLVVYAVIVIIIGWGCFRMREVS